jgi:type II secretory pathway pseudopilin PulG
MKKAFTITELLVAMGLLVAVLSASTMVFHYSIEAQRTAMATSEIMHSLRAITDQLNADFASLRNDGYLVLRSTNDANDAVYFFSTGDFLSWQDSDRRSNTARMYFGPAKIDPNNLVLDIKLLTPSNIKGLDYNDANFTACQTDIRANFEDPNKVLSADRPDVNMAVSPDDARKLLAQNVGSIRIEWTDGSAPSGRIQWFGQALLKVAPFETPGPPYRAVWTPRNPTEWPKALKFTFTLYDSRKILKTGRTFEHIVYIGR